LSAGLRLALAVTLVWLRPLHAVRANRELRHDLDVMLRVASDLAGAVNSDRRERHLYLVKGGKL
jgi:hypothetical protein